MEWSKPRYWAGDADQRADAVLQHPFETLHGLRRHELQQDGFGEGETAVNLIYVNHPVAS
jgi:hypothetical protein